MLTTGARVRNAYATYLLLEDTPWKRGTTLYSLLNGHPLDSKGYDNRWACVGLVSW